jgi:hypothetical protein
MNKIVPQSKKDKFGYYRVGNSEFISKLSAIEHSQKTGKHMQWIFNDIFFQEQDWTIEPSKSLQTLYKERAQRIRNNYDYVVLFYSGGADSHNVLCSFLYNNIPIDEICVCQYSEAEGKDSFWTGEVLLTALPDLNFIRLHYPSITINYLDTTRYLEKIYEGDSRWEWIYQMNTTLAPNNYLRSFIREMTPHYQKIISSGKKMCFVFGSDKPRLEFQDNQYGLYFQDIIDSCVSPRTAILDRTWEHDECFYWSIDSIELLRKQAHSLVKFLRSVNPASKFLIKANQKNSRHTRSNLGTTTIDGEQYYLTTEGQKNILYPYWPKDRFQNKKPFSAVFSPRDSWFFSKNNHNEKIMQAQKYFFNGLKKIEEIVDGTWINPKLTHMPSEYWYDTKLIMDYKISSDLVGCKSPTYWLENKQ